MRDHGPIPLTELPNRLLSVITELVVHNPEPRATSRLPGARQLEEEYDVIPPVAGEQDDEVRHDIPGERYTGVLFVDHHSIGWSG